MEIDFTLEIFSQFKFTEEELRAIQEITQPLRLKRNEHFIHEGDKIDKLALLIEGSLYSYTLDDFSEEAVHHFYFPSKSAVFYLINHAQDEISDVSIKCHQDCILYVFDLQRLHSLYEKFPRMYQIELSTMRQYYRLAMNRIKILQYKNSEDKIEAIKSVSPGIFLNFPFSLIASYLGMHRNTFTRALQKF